MTKKYFGIAVLIAIALLCLPRMGTAKNTYPNVNTITVKTVELETLLSEMAWASPRLSDGRVLYKFATRTCPACIAYYNMEFPNLHAQKVDTRLFVFTRNHLHVPAGEKSVLAQLYKTRSWELVKKWYSVPNPNRFYAKMRDIPDVQSDPQLDILLKTGQNQIARLHRILLANDVAMATPTLLWQDNNKQWKVVVGASAYTNAIIRNELTSNAHQPTQ